MVTGRFGEALRAISDALSPPDTQWYLFGAQAALVYGAARLTADIDITVLMSPEAPEQLVARLVQHGFTLRVADPDFIRQTRVLPVVHAPSTINVDIVLAGPGLEELFLSRAQMHSVDGVQVPTARAEDLIAMKLLAGRPKDLQDVEAVVAAQPSLDVAMLAETLDLLEEALGQSDLVPAFEAIRRRVQGR